MDGILTKRRHTILKVLIACGMLCVGGLWWFETHMGLITDLDRYGYPILLIIFSIALATAILSPSYRNHIELGCYLGIALYFVVSITQFSILQAKSNIYTVANTLQWMPAIYIVAFVLFEKRQAIGAGVGILVLSICAPAAILLMKGSGGWNVLLGALLINAYLVHFMVLLSLSLFLLLRDQYAQASDLAQRMKSSANTDQLTGIANRRGLEEKLEEYGEYPEEPLALILVDIDHFKRINDRFGHLAGDEVLCFTAGLIQKQLEPEDVVGRWGGEEFLVIAPRTDLEEGMQLAERIRRNVHSATHGAVETISVSAGISIWSEGRGLKDTLHLADRSLYEAKRQGRNRIETIDLQTEHPLQTPVGASRLH